MAEYLYDDYQNSEASHAGVFLNKPVMDIIEKISPKRIIELGCGNGAFAKSIGAHYAVTAIDASRTGIEIAKTGYRGNVEFYQDSVYDDLRGKYGTFDCVVSLEVIEHLYDPRLFITNARSLLNNNGIFILSTPYHGYWKNLALALSGKMDAHFTALWDGGHIKFWSIKTISQLLSDHSMHVEQVVCIGRLPALAMSMVVVARKL